MEEEEKKETTEEKTELEFNKKNREDYEHLMEKSSTNLDSYWDRNSPFVRIFLLLLGVIILVGVLYYVMLYLAG